MQMKKNVGRIWPFLLISSSGLTRQTIAWTWSTPSRTHHFPLITHPFSPYRYSSIPSTSSSKFSCMILLANPNANSIPNPNSNPNSNTSTSTHQGEVVGHTGRIGSFFLRQSGGTLAATPRHCPPGELSDVGMPIYACVPASSVPDVIRMTPVHRRSDLVLLANSIPSFCLSVSRLGDDEYNDTDDGDGRYIHENDEDGADGMTVCVLHFAILTHTATPQSQSNYDDNGTNLFSPPSTILRGRHSQTLRDILTPYGIPVEIASSTNQADTAAVRKLIWLSCLWLFCHDVQGNNRHRLVSSSSSSTLTVAEVHRYRGEQLEQLVTELLPAATLLLHTLHTLPALPSKTAPTLTPIPSSTIHHDQVTTVDIGSVQEVIHYLQSYSYSIPTAIPNKNLAIKEMEQRNGLLLALRSRVPQPLHESLIRSVVGDDSVLDSF